MAAKKSTGKKSTTKTQKPTEKSKTTSPAKAEAPTSKTDAKPEATPDSAEDKAPEVEQASPAAKPTDTEAKTAPNPALRTIERKYKGHTYRLHVNEEEGVYRLEDGREFPSYTAAAQELTGQKHLSGPRWWGVSGSGRKGGGKRSPQAKLERLDRKIAKLSAQLLNLLEEAEEVKAAMISATRDEATELRKAAADKEDAAAEAVQEHDDAAHEAQKTLDKAQATDVAGS